MDWRPQQLGGHPRSPVPIAIGIRNGYLPHQEALTVIGPSRGLMIGFQRTSELRRHHTKRLRHNSGLHVGHGHSERIARANHPAAGAVGTRQTTDNDLRIRP